MPTTKKRTRPAKKNAMRDWTLMVYLAGDNNLSSAGAVDLEEMKKVGSTDRVNVVAQYDRSGSRAQTTRYYLRRKTTLTKDAVSQLGETNMGDPAVLEDFVTWATHQYPARHYLLVLWNHGAGWDDSNLYQGDVFEGAPPPVSRKRKAIATDGRRAMRGARPVPLHQVRAAMQRTRRALFNSTVAHAVATRGIAFDDDAQDFLDNIELKKVLARITRQLGAKLDVIGMDACLMSMAEVSYQIRAAAQFTVGSQEEEPGDGWPYDRILRVLTKTPTMSARDLSTTIVREYLASYSSSDAVTQSAVDLGRMDGVIRAIDSLSRALQPVLKTPAGRTAVITARAQVQEYTQPYDQYCDLVHLCTLLSQQPALGSARAGCRAVIDAIDTAVVADGSKNASVANSHGMSIYFPKRKISPLYATLDFTKSSAWGEFLRAYIAALKG